MTLVIGYGNPLRSDDGVGQVVAEAIAARAHAGSGVSAIAAHQLLPEHAEAISGADRVIFVDAEAGGTPGEIRVRELAADTEGSAGLIHDFTPGTLLAYADLLYGHAPPAVLVTVSGFSFDHGEGLSAQMTAVLPAVIARTAALLSR